MRKIIQVATDKGFLFALCEDGSVYIMDSQSQSWDILPAIPQDDAQEQPSDVIDASTQEVVKQVSIRLSAALARELIDSDLCNILTELSALVYSQAEDVAREREGELIISRAEAEGCNEYQNYMLQYEMLVNFAEAADLADHHGRWDRDEKQRKLIDELNKIQVS